MRKRPLAAGLAAVVLLLAPWGLTTSGAARANGARSARAVHAPRARRERCGGPTRTGPTATRPRAHRLGGHCMPRRRRRRRGRAGAPGNPALGGSDPQPASPSASTAPLVAEDQPGFPPPTLEAPPAGGEEAASFRFFSASSVWNQPLAANAPLDPDSSQMIAGFQRLLAAEVSEARGPWINTSSSSVPIYSVAADQPTVAVTLANSPHASLSEAWARVPLPAGARPGQGSDAELVLYQPSSDRMWEFWRLAHTETGWRAAWGGAIAHTSQNPGVYGPQAWPGAETSWGASASSLSIAGGLITLKDLQEHQIDHALAAAIPDAAAGIYTSPAQRTDGRSTAPDAIPEGAHLRLDPTLQLTSLHLPPLTLMIAQAAQRYGIIIRDYAPNITLYAQDPTPNGTNPYTGPTGYLENKTPIQLLENFPWKHLQLLKMSTRST